MTSWSYSSMTLFQQCPKKYFHLRVAKDIIEPPSEQMRYGLDVHKAAEEYVRDGTALPPAYGYMKTTLDALICKPGDKYCEHKMALTADLQPCDFLSKEVWWRGIADLLVVNGTFATVVDYKTGKSRFADTKQLELLALATFIHFPEVLTVKAGLLFVVHNDFVKEKFLREEQVSRWEKWRKQSEQLDEAFTHNVWNPKQNFTCRQWCPVTSCAHNGRN
jgi:hypothetical protein